MTSIEHAYDNQLEAQYPNAPKKYAVYCTPIDEGDDYDVMRIIYDDGDDDVVVNSITFGSKAWGKRIMDNPKDIRIRVTVLTCDEGCMFRSRDSLIYFNSAEEAEQYNKKRAL